MNNHAIPATSVLNDMLETLERSQGQVRNFHRVIDMSSYLVETALFPRSVLEAYSRYNLGETLTADETAFFNETRGGKQGDYREHMQQKIANVVSCLNEFPASKRALITICNDPLASHTDDDHAKCMREIHFHLDPQKSHLNATVLFRAQAAQIFPKNIHFIGELMTTIARQLDGDWKPSELWYLTSVLVSDRR